MFPYEAQEKWTEVHDHDDLRSPGRLQAARSHLAGELEQPIFRGVHLMVREHALVDHRDADVVDVTSFHERRFKRITDSTHIHQCLPARGERAADGEKSKK